MSDIRSDPYVLKDPNDNDAFSVLKDDVRLVKQLVQQGTPAAPSTAGLQNQINAHTTRLNADEAAIAALKGQSSYRTIADCLYATGSGSMATSNVSQGLVASTVQVGTLSGLNVGTGVWTCPADGVYMLAATVSYGSVALTAADARLVIASSSNGFASEYDTPSGSGACNVSASLVVWCVNGTTMTITGQVGYSGGVQPSYTLYLGISRL